MSVPGVNAFDAFVASTRALYRQGLTGEPLWRGVKKNLEVLVRNEAFRRLTDSWPNGEGKQYVIYQDPDCGFVVDALVRIPYHKAPAHDHAHTWTVYGIVSGWERMTRYLRKDDGSNVQRAQLEEVSQNICQAGTVDVVPPWEIHTESNDDNRAVALVVRSENLGGFDQTIYRADGSIGKMRGLERIAFNIRQ